MELHPDQEESAAMPVVAIVGAGVIGVSWARLFAGTGWEVRVTDPRPDLAEVVDKELAGLAVTVAADLATAASGADFVQESAPSGSTSSRRCSRRSRRALATMSSSRRRRRR